MSDGSSGSDYPSYECLAFDISQEFLHGNKDMAVNMLRKATEIYDYNLIMNEIKSYGWFDWNDLHEFYHAAVTSYRLGNIQSADSNQSS